MPNKVTMISVGQVIKAKKGFDYQVIEIINSRKVFVKFLDEFGAVVKGTACQAATGQLINPCGRYTYGVGYIGQGPYKTTENGKPLKRFKCWQSMFERVYGGRETSPSYADVKVNLVWHCYQVFAEWFDNNYVEGWQLDKDIRIKGSREYGPESCCFVPREINNKSAFKISTQNKYNLGVYYCSRDDLYLSMESKIQTKSLKDAILNQKVAMEAKFKGLYEKYLLTDLHVDVLEKLRDYTYPYFIPLCLKDA